MIKVQEYLEVDGRSPFSKWFDGLDAQAALKVNTYLTRAGNGNFSQVKTLGKGVHECRIDWGPGYRVYFGQDGKRSRKMPITRNFKETTQARALRDPEFRQGLLTESIENMLSGDIETGKSVLRDYINATIGFEKLGALTDKSPKSLMRMFSPKGNPTVSNLFGIIHTIQEKEGLRFQVHAVH